MKNNSFGKKIITRVISLFMAVLLLATSSPIVRFDLLFKAGASYFGSGLDEASSPDSNVINSDKNRNTMNFNKNWKFHLGEIPKDEAKLRTYDDSDWETVSLPHDYSITQQYTTTKTEAESGMLPGGTGWYHKWFTLPTALNEKEIVVNFGGVYKDATVYVNGKKILENHYGYNSFYANITKYVVADGKTINLIAVKVEDELPNSRFYAGAGICRDVVIETFDNIHVLINGISILTEQVRSESDGRMHATGNLSANLTIHNDFKLPKDVTIKAEVLDAEGNLVSNTFTKTIEDVPYDVKTNVALTDGHVEDPILWSVDNPYMYTARVTLSADGEVYDIYEKKFGFRATEFDVNNGFYLNGEPVKLKGVSMHSDQGGLGSVQAYDAIYRQVSILKDMGVNAIRTTHNIPSKNFLKVCNELGMLVVEEIFDKWYVVQNKNTNDFNLYFNKPIDTKNNHIIDAEEGDTWASYVIKKTVKRDMDNPCVIMWSLGNELTGNELTDRDLAEKMQKWVKNYDPSRPTTWGNNTAKFQPIDEVFDAVGINYNTGTRGTLAATANSNGKPVYLSETASAVFSRGEYGTLGRVNGTLNPNTGNRYYLTSYDLINTNVGNTWGEQSQAAWWATITNNNYAGEFVWTGFDYLGEPTPWNDVEKSNLALPNSSFFGIVDTAGFPKDSYYLYRSWWNENSTTLHMLPGTWDRNRLALDTSGYVYVPVYSNAAKIELRLKPSTGGDILIGSAESSLKKTANNLHSYRTWTEQVENSSYCKITKQYNSTGKELFAQFMVKHTDGELYVKAFDQSGAEITNTVGTTSVSSTVTSSSAKKIASKVWSGNEPGKTQTFYGDGSSYVYFELEAQTTDGKFVNDYNGDINVYISGPGTIAAVDNGNQNTTEKHQQQFITGNHDRMHANVKFYNGRALVIVKTNDNLKGEISTGTIYLVQSQEDKDGGQKPVLDGASVLVDPETGERELDEFEEVCPQNPNLKFIPTTLDKYEVLSELISELETAELEDSKREFNLIPSVHNYRLYTPRESRNKAVADGTYILYSEPVSGYTTDSRYISGEKAEDGKFNTIPYQAENHIITTSDVHTFTFTNAGNNLYFVQNKEGKYLSLIDGTGVVLSEEPTKLYLRTSEGANGTKKISLYQPHKGSCAHIMQLANDSSNKITISASGEFLFDENYDPMDPIAEFRSFYLYSDVGEVEKNIYDKHFVNLNGSHENVTYTTSTESWSGILTEQGEGVEKVHSFVPDGWYAITGNSGGNNPRTAGTLTGTEIVSGSKLGLETSGDVIKTNDIVWLFEKVNKEDENDTKYNISFGLDGTKKYLNITDDGLSISTENHQELDVILDTATSTVKIGSGDNFIKYSADVSRFADKSTQANATSLNLYSTVKMAEGEKGSYIYETSNRAWEAQSTTQEIAGWYAIKGISSGNSDINQGVITSNTVTAKGNSGTFKGLSSSNSPHIRMNDQAWFFFKNYATGKYRISTYDETNQRVYLKVYGDEVTTVPSDVAEAGEVPELDVIIENGTNGTTVVLKGDRGNKDTDSCINFYPLKWKVVKDGVVTNQEAYFISQWKDGTKLTLYKSRGVQAQMEVNPNGAWSCNYVEPGETIERPVDYVPNGWYSIFGSNAQNKGALTSSDEATVSAAGTEIQSNDQAWYFERVDEENNLYTVSTYSNGKPVYLSLSENGASVSETKQNLTVEKAENSNKIIIKNGSNALTYGEEAIEIGTVTEANLNLYTSECSALPPTASPFEDGKYVIYNPATDSVMSNYLEDGGLFDVAEHYRLPDTNPSGTELKTSPSCEYQFTCVNAQTNEFTVQDQYGNYLCVENGELALSKSEKTVTLTSAEDGNVIISNADNRLAVSSIANSKDFVSTTDTADESKAIMSLYSFKQTLSEYYGYPDAKEYVFMDASQVIDDGIYVFKAPDRNSKPTVITPTPNATSGRYEVSNNVTLGLQSLHLITDHHYEFQVTYHSTNADGSNNYYIQNGDGEYLKFNSSGNTTFSPDATTLVIERLKGSEANKVVIKKNNDNGIPNYLDVYASPICWSNWANSNEYANQNQKFNLYTVDSTSIKTEHVVAPASRYSELIDVMLTAVGIENITIFSDETVIALVNALDEGYSLILESSSDTTAISTAVQKVKDAMEALTTSVTSFPSTLYKYGYTPSKFNPYNSTKYAEAYGFRGSMAYNKKNIETMKNALLDDPDIRAQIENVVDGVHTGATGTGERTIIYDNDSLRDEAIKKVAGEYARIYTLLFTANGVADDNSTKDEGLTGNPEKQPAWNVWEKKDTIGADDNRNQGSSVQGIFSSELINGLPKSHIAYPYLGYLNNSVKQGLRAESQVTVTVGATGTKNIRLPGLQNVSVYVNDFFSRENVENTDKSYSSAEYLKYYWDTEFPFVVGTDKYGVSTYEYDSSNTSYELRAYFDDANQTAVTKLTETDLIYDLDGTKDDRTDSAFLPFNYQLTQEQAEMKETVVDNKKNADPQKAIYHFGMSFSTDFYMPLGGTYTNKEEIIFDFSGDDDVLVYVDGKLILDNGGLHGARRATINFTRATVGYQYVTDLYDTDPATGTAPLKASGSDGENAVVYNTDRTNQYMTSPDSKAAIEYLERISGDGKNHTLSFYYLERGSTASNCKIKFNMQPLNGTARLEPQKLVSDFGLDVEKYNVTSNNSLNGRKEKPDGFYYDYVGVIKGGNESKLPNFYNRFDYKDLLKDNLDLMFDGNDEASINGKFGTLTADSTGNVSYKQKNMQFFEPDTFYLVAEVHGDPLYMTGAVFYDYEEVTFLPATTIYYEDNYTGSGEDASGITYIDGDVEKRGSHTFGKWETVTEADVTPATEQAADLVGSADANVYGYDGAYASFPKYSNGSVHKVSTSTLNSKKWPAAEFTFTGTGFDIVSLTSKETGVFFVTATNTETGKKVSKIVDTYYGYSYGQIYRTPDGEPTLESGDGQNTVMYKSVSKKVSEAGDVSLDKMTQTPTYYNSKNDVVKEVWYMNPDKAATQEPHHYEVIDGEKVIVYGEAGEGQEPAYNYAYAMGWLKNTTGDNVELFQIPVIHLANLDYGTWKVRLEARYTKIFGHNMTAEGVDYFDLYFDGVRIYEPAGPATADGGTSNNAVVSEAYQTDGEAYTYFSRIKEMIRGAETIDAAGHENGAVFIDGRETVGTKDLDAYLKAGPNNELYLDGGQAVAFEIWATKNPIDVQVGLKTAKQSADGTKPTFKVIYGSNTKEALEISTSTAMNYSLNSCLDSQNKLRWTHATDENGNRVSDEQGRPYFTSGTIILKNTSDKGAVLSITNIKWTFNVYGEKGIYKIPTKVENESATTFVSQKVMKRAVRMMASTYADPIIDESTVKTEQGTTDGKVTIKFETSNDVNEIVVKDKDGNPINLDKVESVVNELEQGGKKEWTVTLTEAEAGTYTYTIVGVYDGEYSSNSAPIQVTVTVKTEEPITPPTTEETPKEDEPENGGTDKPSEEKPSKENFFQMIIRTLKSIVDKILALFGLVRG